MELLDPMPLRDPCFSLLHEATLTTEVGPGAMRHYMACSHARPAVLQLGLNHRSYPRTAAQSQQMVAGCWCPTMDLLVTDASQLSIHTRPHTCI